VPGSPSKNAGSEETIRGAPSAVTIQAPFHYRHPRAEAARRTAWSVICCPTVATCTR